MWGLLSNRVGVYIDGFNLFFAIKRKRWKHFYWYDPYQLAFDLCRTDETLVFCKYFTARVANNPEKQKRQASYLDALAAHSKAEIIYGRYKDEEHYCIGCGNRNKVPKEKMTDVNIAVQMLRDGFEDKWDRVILISGDSDLVPPLKALQELFPHKVRTLVFPPDQYTKELYDLSSSKLSVGQERLTKAALPEEILTASGHKIKRPARWSRPI